MDILDHSEDEEQSHYGGDSGRASRFGAKSHHQLLLMDYIAGNGEGALKEAVPLPEYERLSQSARLPDDPDPKNPQPSAPQQQRQLPVKQSASPRLQQKPAAWRLIEYMRSRNKKGGGAGAPAGRCNSSDGDSRSSDGEKDGDDGGAEGRKDKKKKRSPWLPDPDRRWPVQGFYY